jgi:hypothetical protein
VSAGEGRNVVDGYEFGFISCIAGRGEDTGSGLRNCDETALTETVEGEVGYGDV